jgi:AbiJ N-terminal domain 4
VIFDLFSKRKKQAANQDAVDVYQYKNVPDKLRVQIQQIMKDAIGPQYLPNSFSGYERYKHNLVAWKSIHKTLCRELGKNTLGQGRTQREEIINFLNTSDAEGFVDGVELCCRYIFHTIKPMNNRSRQELGIEQAPDDALVEINYRFLEAQFGFQFEEGIAFQIDSEFAHEEIIKPALRILSASGYEGAREEFLNAHRHYRAGENEQAISEVAKAFESTLKSVCNKKGWHLRGARASDLLKLVKSNGLWPDYLDGSFDQLLATLTSGLPKMRNENAAHGQGQTIRSTPRYVVTYALNLAASKIVFVADAARAEN